MVVADDHHLTLYALKVDGAVTGLKRVNHHRSIIAGDDQRCAGILSQDWSGIRRLPQTSVR